jgi:hypothetical protein
VDEISIQTAPVDYKALRGAAVDKLAFPEIQLLAEKLTEDLNKQITAAPFEAKWSVQIHVPEGEESLNESVATRLVAKHFQNAGYDCQWHRIDLTEEQFQGAVGRFSAQEASPFGTKFVVDVYPAQFD